MQGEIGCCILLLLVPKIVLSLFNLRCGSFLSSTKQNISDTRDGHHLHKHCVAVLVVCTGGIVYIRLCGWVWMALVAYCAYINVWRYVVVHVQMCTCVPSVVDGVGAGVFRCVLA